MRTSFSAGLVWAVLLLGVLLSTSPLYAQSAAYWATSSDSLRRVLAGQSADADRLRTLRHLADLSADPNSAYATTQLLPELVATTGRLQDPSHRAYQRLLAASRLLAQAPPQAAALDSLQAAVVDFDRLGQPAFVALTLLSTAYAPLRQLPARRPYYLAKLAYYQSRADSLDAGCCAFIEGGTYYRQGDYDAAIGYYLRGTQQLRRSNPPLARNGLCTVGNCYVEWGNYARGLRYFQQFLAQATPLPADQDLVVFVNLNIATIYLRQQRYALAQGYLHRALALGRSATVSPGLAAFSQAPGLVLESTILLGQGQVAAAGRLLPRAQHLIDSLHLPLSSGAGVIELAATWARYYVARHEPARAEVAWLRAYGQAQAAHVLPLRLRYAQEVARFYQQQDQAARALPYALLALRLADSLELAQRARYVSRYELTQAARTQQARLAALRLAQVQQAARVRRQRLLLGATLLVLVLVAGLGYVLWRGSRRRQRANEALGQLNAELTAQRDQTTRALTELQATQAQLIQKEKMASLGELTAGIAHEMQNPLNFVNNFADVSAELVGELRQELTRGDLTEAHALAADLEQNLQKIHQHGSRASGIVRGMLAHSRHSPGERQSTNVNTLAEEYLRLAYQGLRAKDASFNAALHTEWAADLAPVNAVPGDLGRVLLNLFTNAFYAVQQRQRLGGEAGYVPTVRVRTRQVGKQVEVAVQDNGTGMRPEVQAKVFQPFFTTKPAGEGTGLGLSLSYDIVTQGHGGALTVESEPGHGSLFRVVLPSG